MQEVNSILLILDGHCIETSAKKRLDELIKKSIEEDVEGRVLNEIEFLRSFIENTDFSRLRAQNPYLDGRKKLTVKINRIGDREFEIGVVDVD